jgi:hypothetical protein
VEFSVGTTLDVIVPLDFEGSVIRPATGAFDKTVVEGGHESCGIYTKKRLTAEHAEIGESIKMLLSCFLSALCVLGGEYLPLQVPQGRPRHLIMLG